ncbi:hypothetical protein BDN70DRAFT_877394 [Pholiota conissans]|uniref:F-box domain-containing protein n=1 Tax=Pholiota conissans TaxID=109636 RepID=A0A9P6D1N1_9AGAR|nr:hypothetical protein BDN70DRAFT_877394 [Pholiota conissans]
MDISSVIPSKSRSRGPIENLPIDVLREIFTLCLPRIPLDDAFQPNLHEAPMLLCHICSFWRMVALTTPTLWNRLTYCFTVHQTTPQFGSWAFLEDQVEFVRWWQANHESIAPFLTISSDIVYSGYERDTVQEWVPVEEIDHFLEDYFMTAQYLDLDGFFWSRILKRAEGLGHDGYCFPNLHTVVERLSWGQLALPFLGPTLDKHPSRVRRLHVADTKLRFNDDTDINLWNWTSLTHISFVNVSMTPEFILTLLSAVPNLQWGHFDIGEWYELDDYKPVKYTLSHLHTLCISLCDEHCLTTLSLSSLFSRLHFRILDTLVLFSSSDSWRDHRAATELSTILMSAPNLMTLGLLGCFLSFGSNETEPLWKYTPKLTHLEIETTAFTQQNNISTAEVDAYISDVFSRNNGWFDLTHPACPIHDIAVNIVGLSGDLKRVAEARFRDLNENVNVPNIGFQLSSRSMFDEIGAELREWSMLN